MMTTTCDICGTTFWTDESPTCHKCTENKKLKAERDALLAVARAVDNDENNDAWMVACKAWGGGWQNIQADVIDNPEEWRNVATHLYEYIKGIRATLEAAKHHPQLIVAGNNWRRFGRRNREIKAEIDPKDEKEIEKK